MMKIQSIYLVAYFSAGGTTEKIAKILSEGVSADLLPIVPKEQYSAKDVDWRRFFARCNREHRRNIFPSIEEPEEDLNQYSVIFLGCPIWYDKVPNVVKSFLHLRDWSGRKIVLFATSGGSGIENAAEDLKQFVGNDKIIEAKLFEAGAGQETVTKWGKGILAKLDSGLKQAAFDYLEKEFVEKEESPSNEIRFSREPSGVKFSLDLSSQEDRYNQATLQKTLSPAVRSVLTGSGGGRDFLRKMEANMDQSFAGRMRLIIRAKNMTEPEVYKAALVDRKLFSKIISDPGYKPSKDTCVALAYALHLDLEEANDLLSRAGFTLSHSNKRDVLLEYFFATEKYNIYDINQVLSELGERPLGRQS